MGAYPPLFAEFVAVHSRQDIQSFIESVALKKNEERVLLMCLQDLNCKEIGIAIGYSDAYVSKLRRSALAKIERYLLENLPKN